MTRQAFIKLRMAEVVGRSLAPVGNLMDALQRSLAEQGAQIKRLDELIATNTAILEREKKRSASYRVWNRDCKPSTSEGRAFAHI